VFSCLLVAGIIGHVAVDFLAHRGAHGLCLWAVDLELRPTASLCSYQIFDFLSAGQFDVVSGSYWVAVEQQQSSQQSSVQPLVQLNSGLDTNASAQAGTAAQAAAPSAVQTSTGEQYAALSAGAVAARGSIVTAGVDAAAAQQPLTEPAEVVATGEVDSAAAPTSTGGVQQQSAQAQQQRGQSAERVIAQQIMTQASQPVPLPHYEQRFFVSIDQLYHPNLSAMRSAQFFHHCRVANLSYDMLSCTGVSFNMMDAFSGGMLGVQTSGPSPTAAFEQMSKVDCCIAHWRSGVRTHAVKKIVKLTHNSEARPRFVSGSGTNVSLGRMESMHAVQQECWGWFSVAVLIAL
jgi:hypothetical protein